jgi:hypothetical protein
MTHEKPLTPVQLDYRLRGSAREPVNLATDAIYDQEKIKRSKYSDICDFTYLNPKITGTLSQLSNAIWRGLINEFQEH